MDFFLNDDDQAIVDGAEEFCKKEIIPVAAGLDRTMEFPDQIILKAHEAGLLNLSAPESVGGLGVSHLVGATISEKLAFGCSGIATVMTANDLALGPLLIAGTQQQIKKFAQPMIDSPILAAYCVTEPGAGSDVAGIKTTAIKKKDKYILNGEKMWITNASKANWFFVLATTDSKLGYKGMVAFAVPANLPGIQVGKKEVNLGQRCSDTRGISFQNVEIPAENLLGKEGDGFKIAMGAFDKSRPAVAAVAVGIAQSALEHSVRYANERTTFGKPIKNHQAVAFMIADMAKNIEASRLLYQKAAWMLDKGHKNSLAASMAKCLAGDTAVQVSQDAVQVFGGYGFNNEYPVEKLYRDAKICQIYEGTQQIQRLIISRAVLG